MIDAQTVDRLRREQGMSRSELATACGLQIGRLRGLLNGTNYEKATLGAVERLAAALGVHPATILQGGRDHRSASRPDDAKLEALLAAAGKRMARDDLCDALGWNLNRLRRAREALGDRLEGSGTRLDVLPGGLLLCPRLDAVDERALQVLTRRASPKLGMSHIELQILRMLFEERIAFKALDKGEMYRKALVKLERAGYVSVAPGR